MKAYGDAAGGIDISSYATIAWCSAGPPKPAGLAGHRRWRLMAVYLFDAQTFGGRVHPSPREDRDRDERTEV
jgi:hypothetical protein